MTGSLVATMTGSFTRLADHVGRTIGPYGAVGIVLVAAVVIVSCMLWTASRRSTSLAERIEPYRMREAAVAPEPAEDTAAVVVTVPPLRRAAAALEGPARRTRAGRWLGRMLERSDLPITLGELVLVWVIGGPALVAIGLLLAHVVGALLVAVVVVVGPLALLTVLVERRTRRFESQLPDVLKLSASSLRAGFSFAQSLDSVVRQIKPPAQTELQQVLSEVRLGRPLDEALADAAARIQNKDFSEAVMAVRIQQETGGNLASLLDVLAETMTQRLRMRREVRALTAEGRASAFVLGVLPAAIAIFIFAVNRPYISVLFHSFGGEVALVAGIVLELVGFFWMYRIVKIEV